jgi:hypothetical protein
MEIVTYDSGPDHECSLKGDGTRRSRALSQASAISLRCESYNIRNTEACSSQMNGQAAGSNHAARGAVVGILLGASLWGAILVFAGLIKL